MLIEVIGYIKSKCSSSYTWFINQYSNDKNRWKYEFILIESVWYKQYGGVYCLNMVTTSHRNL